MTKAGLEARHLAELHELAAEAEVPRYRLLPRDELVEELLVRGAGGAAAPGDERRGGEEDADDEPFPEEGREERADARGERRGGRRRRRGRRGGDRRRDDERGDRDDDREERDEAEPVKGLLDVLPAGHGFIRVAGLEEGEDDVYVSASQIRRCELRPGDEVAGPARPPRRGERHPALVRVERVNGVEPGEATPSFEDLTPVQPSRRIPLEPAPEDLLVRAVALLAPPAYGQRVLVTARPRSGRTTLLRGLARAIASAADAPELLVVLVDERPEEVTEWRRQVEGAEVIAAPADLDPREQARRVEMAVAQAKRRVQAGADVVVLLDSLTRLGVALGDVAAVKPVFGAGRELEEDGAGSLTVIATALRGTEDGDAALEAVETTESATIALDAELAGAGVTPALDVAATQAVGEDSLRDPDELERVRQLRAELRELDPRAAAERLAQVLAG